MITPAQRAEIRHLYYGEHWKIANDVYRRCTLGYRSTSIGTSRNNGAGIGTAPRLRE